MENTSENQPEPPQSTESATSSNQRRVVSGADLSNWGNLTQREKEETSKRLYQSLLRGISDE